MSENDDLLIRIGLTEQKYMQALARIEAQTVKAAKKNEAAFKKANRSFQSGAAQANRSANTFANGGLRNMSMQFSQVIQQGAVTGDYMRALAVQIPDMAIGFGALGVAAGAFAPILFTIAQNALGASEAVQKMKDSLDKLSEGTASAREEIEMLIRGLSSVEELRAMQGIADLERQIAAAEAEKEGLSGRNLRAVELRVRALEQEKLEAENTLAEYRNTTSQLELIKGLGEDISNTDMGAGIRSALGSAEQLYTVLTNAQMAAQNMSDAKLDRGSLYNQYSMYGEGQSAMRTAQMEDAYAPEGGWGGTFKAPSTSRGGGGGSVRDLSKEYESLRASLDSAYAALKQYEESQEVLNLALKAGKIDQSEYSATLDLATAKYEEATKQAELFDLSTQSIGESILDIASNGADAFDSLAQSIQKAALEYALFGKSGVAGLGTGDAGGLLGGLLGGLFEANAKGGVYNSAGLSAYSGSVVSSPTVFPFAKGAGLMGEAGPEAILPLTRGANGKLGVQAQGGSGTTFQIIDQRSASAPDMETRTTTGPDGRELVTLVIKDEIAKGSLDKSMSGRFGTRTQKVSR
jgi:Phage-related minor tail protein